MPSTNSRPVKVGGRVKTDDIAEALTRAPFIYDDGATQVFTSDGRTTYTENEAPTFGEWGIADQGQFWSFWPPSYRANYDVFSVLEDDHVVGLRFIELRHGATSDGRYMPILDYRKDPERVAKLTADQYDVTQKAATEPAFRNAYWDNHEAGLYVDIVSGEPLFTSIDKFDSGTGWPCFTAPIDTSNVVLNVDRSYDMVRTEVRSKYGDSHLGHLFNDGPPSERGTRYCMNSAALRFIPLDQLQAAGYGQFRELFPTEAESS